MTGRHERGLRSNANIAGKRDRKPCARSRSGQRGDRGFAQGNQRTCQRPLLLSNILDTLVPGDVFAATAAHTLDVAAGAEGSSGAGD